MNWPLFYFGLGWAVASAMWLGVYHQNEIRYWIARNVPEWMWRRWPVFYVACSGPLFGANGWRSRRNRANESWCFCDVCGVSMNFATWAGSDMTAEKRGGQAVRVVRCPECRKEATR